MARRSSARRRMLATAIAAGLLAGCGSDLGDDAPVPKPTRLAADTGPPGDLTPIIGKYRYRASSRETQVASGQWNLLLGPERFLLVEPGGKRTVGRYSVKRKRATFSGGECGSVRGSYRWRVTDGVLVFTDLGDPCTGRSAILTAEPWSPQIPGAPDDRPIQEQAPATIEAGSLGYEAGADTPQIAFGRWLLDLRSPRFSITQPDGTELQGTYRVKGDEVAFRGAGCGKVPGVYGWAFEGTKLRFTVREDPCGNRVAILTAKPWDTQAD